MIERLTFADGIPGFTQHKSWALQHPEDEGLFFRLYPEDHPALVFHCCIPWVFHHGYELDFKIEDIIALGLHDDQSEMGIYCIMNTKPKDDRSKWTVNLFAPLVINHGEAIGAQLVNQIETREYSTRDVLLIPGLPVPVSMKHV